MARQKWFVEVGISFPLEFFVTAHKVHDWLKLPREWETPEDAMLRHMYDRVRIECQLQWPGLQDWSCKNGESGSRIKHATYVAYDARRRSVLFVTGSPEALDNLVVSRAPFGGSPFIVEIVNPPSIQLPVAVREVA